jgi:hypothetical protein
MQTIAGIGVDFAILGYGFMNERFVNSHRIRLCIGSIHAEIAPAQCIGFAMKPFTVL